MSIILSSNHQKLCPIKGVFMSRLVSGQFFSLKFRKLASPPWMKRPRIQKSFNFNRSQKASVVSKAPKEITKQLQKVERVDIGREKEAEVKITAHFDIFTHQTPPHSELSFLLHLGPRVSKRKIKSSYENKRNRKSQNG